MPVTQLSPNGVSGQRYSFVAKEGTTPSPAICEPLTVVVLNNGQTSAVVGNSGKTVGVALQNGSTSVDTCPVYTRYHSSSFDASHN